MEVRDSLIFTVKRAHTRTMLESLGRGIGGLILGILLLVIAIGVPILLFILTAALFGFGFGIGLSVSPIGKAIIGARR